MGPRAAPDRGSRLSTYVLDSTVLIAYLRDIPPMASVLQRLLADGHTLGTTCVNLAEIERGLRPRDRERAFSDRQTQQRSGYHRSPHRGETPLWA